MELYRRSNQSPPSVEKDFLIYDATKSEHSPENLDKILSMSANLNIPVLVQNFSSIHGAMGSVPETSTIDMFLAYQASRCRPNPSCQIQGEVENQNQTYDFLLQHFSTSPESRESDINLLDLPIESDLRLIEGFNSPAFITKRDLIDFATKRPDAHKLRDGLKVPSIRRWMLVSGHRCVSGFHRDMLGLWTAVEVQEGEKLWAWAEQCEENVSVRAEYGAYDSVSRFTKIFALTLRAGDLFIMPPGVIHSVVTKGDSLAAGIHFLLPETLDRSIVLAKGDVKDDTLTNDVRKGRDFYAALISVSLLQHRKRLIINQNIPTIIKCYPSEEAVAGVKRFLLECQKRTVWKFSLKDLQEASSSL